MRGVAAPRPVTTHNMRSGSQEQNMAAYLPKVDIRRRFSIAIFDRSRVKECPDLQSFSLRIKAYRAVLDQCRLRLWVNRVGLTVCRSLPVHLEQRTSTDRPCWSGSRPVSGLQRSFRATSYPAETP
jgi:hypothetical protein